LLGDGGDEGEAVIVELVLGVEDGLGLLIGHCEVLPCPITHGSALAWLPAGPHKSGQASSANADRCSQS
jgi:hypothetical protein